MIARNLLLLSLSVARAAMAFDDRDASASETTPDAALAPVPDAPPPATTAPTPPVVEAAKPKAPAPGEPATESFAFELQARRLRIMDDRFGIFASERGLGLGGIAARATLLREGPWTFVLGVGMEGHAALTGKVRTGTASIAIDRPTLRAEALYAITPSVALAGSLALGGERLALEYSGAAMQDRGKATSWSATGDLALGVDAQKRFESVVLGARLEGGFLASQSHELRVSLPDVGDVSRVPVDLGLLSLSGGFFRIAARLGF